MTISQTLELALERFVRHRLWPWSAKLTDLLTTLADCPKARSVWGKAAILTAA
jgi:hypothetical protein